MDLNSGGITDDQNPFSVKDEENNCEQEDPISEDVSISALHNFEDEKFVSDLISNILDIARDPILIESKIDRLKDILDHYQEQPQLVDSYLGSWVGKLMMFVKEFAENPNDVTERSSRLSLTVLRLLTKLRGYKIIIRFLPHHVGDVEQSLGLLEKLISVNIQDWEEQYVLLLWLSITIQVPFDLRKLTDIDDIGTERSIEQRVLRICKTFIVVPEKTRDAAAFLLSRFVTRPDILPQHGENVISFLIETLRNAKSQDIVKAPHILCGCLLAIAEIFKSGTRVHLKSLAEFCLSRLINLDLLSSQYSLVRKFCCKALQRLGLIYLPVKLPSWRYKRGYRSLEENVIHGGPAKPSSEMLASTPSDMINGSNHHKQDESEVPEAVEEIIGYLLRGLNDCDGIVRWSAAKGIGRISERLPLSFAEDVQTGVFDLFSYEHSENAWHGGCLALAELSRRGAILPSRFPEVIKVVLKALLYEELRGPTAVGSQVRDAACYVCWSFARAYEAKDLANFVDEIAKHLVLTAVFDRNVNCRRAAAAAFQEHVGRQGTFPHGLEIVPILDFESLGRRTTTYLKLSPLIASFSDYTNIILDFLVHQRLGHWDAQTRELSAETLLVLTPIAPNYVAEKVVPEILSRVSSSHLFTRHGAIISLGCVLEGLHISGQFDQALSDRVEDIILQMDPNEIYRGLGHEFIRQAVLKFVSRLSRADLPFHRKGKLLDHILQLILMNFPIVDVKIQETAVVTLEKFLFSYGDSLLNGSSLQERTLKIVLENLSSSSEVIRRVYVLALCVFPVNYTNENLDIIVENIVGSCPRATHSEPRWVDCRRNCCRSLEKLIEITTPSSFNSKHFGAMVDFLCSCLTDYTEDRRGNIGRIVRLASLEAIKVGFIRIAKTRPEVLTPERMQVVVENLVRLFTESIPDIRSRSGQTLLQLCKSLDMPDFPFQRDLLKCFQNHNLSQIVWLSGSSTYPIAMDLLSIPELQYVVLLGLISSLGSATESTIRESSSALRKYCRNQAGDSTSALKSIAVSLNCVIGDTIKDDRLALPALRSLQQIFAVGVFYGNLDSNEPGVVVDLLDTIQSVRRSQSTPKVVCLIEIYAEALQFSEPIRKVALERMLPFLTHVYPRVRVVTATKLHEALITNDDVVSPEESDTFSDILNETEWAFSLEKSQEALKRIASLLHIPVKAMVLKVKPAGSKVGTDVKG